MQNILNDFETFETTLKGLATADLDETSWADRRREQVVDLLNRGSRLLAAIDPSGNQRFAAMRWDETDSPVMLTRAFARVHHELAALDTQTAQPVLAA